MAKHELVMSAEHPYWQTVLYEGVGRKEILIEETSIREICGRVAVREIAEYDAEMAKIYANRKFAHEECGSRGAERLAHGVISSVLRCGKCGIRIA